VERALWAALRALEEKAAMLRRMSVRFTSRDLPRVSARFERKANGVLEEALAIRALLRDVERVDDVFEEAAGES
jgi:two-component system chemotaxis response regulator CheB